MGALGRALAVTERVRARAARERAPREELIASYVAGRSFADVGCMWKVDGALCFAAEAAGAARVTGVDVMPASAAFEERRSTGPSAVRFVRGDIHEPATVAEVGVHDVVWCSGVVYHAPHPVLTLERLREITGDTLILATQTIPEVPGLPRAAVFAPDPGSNPAHTEPFESARGYAGWWWGLTASAVLAMLAAVGMEVVEEHRMPFHLTVVAR